MSDNFNLWVTAHTPVGKFQGLLNNAPLSVDSLEKMRDNVERSANKLDFMVLYEGTAAEITLPGTLVKNSVLVFFIKEAE